MQKTLDSMSTAAAPLSIGWGGCHTGIRAWEAHIVVNFPFITVALIFVF